MGDLLDMGDGYIISISEDDPSEMVRKEVTVASNSRPLVVLWERVPFGFLDRYRLSEHQWPWELSEAVSEFVQEWVARQLAAEEAKAREESAGGGD